MNYNTFIILLVAFISDNQIYCQLNQCSFLANYDTNGAILTTATTSTQNECCLLCQLNTQCQSWTWTNTRVCCLRSTVGQVFYSLGSKYNFFVLFIS